jgi:uncharacterized protein YifN (PemK superfamily)
MSINTPRFVKRGQVFICDFEACSTISTGMICFIDKKAKHPSCGFSANIKPEIGKFRPVVVIYPHKRSRLALVAPFTTKKPAKEMINTLHIPAGAMPGILRQKECWALCDILQAVNLNRLQQVYYDKTTSAHQNLKQSYISDKYFLQITEKIRRIIG